MSRTSPLYSKYIIDGVPQDFTPAWMLDSACGRVTARTEDFDAIVDESEDPSPLEDSFPASLLDSFLSDPVKLSPSDCPPGYAAAYARERICTALIESIWQNGHYRFGDLAVESIWRWTELPAGTPAAFYQAVSAACELLDKLGLPMESYSFTPSGRRLDVLVKTRETNPEEEQASLLGELPFQTHNPSMEPGRRCPVISGGQGDNLLIYIPFDTGPFRLGGSAAAVRSALQGGHAPAEPDADYFMDCYEVVRELVEDGIVLGGASVGRGGLACALARMCTGGIRPAADLWSLMKAYGEEDMCRVLLAEMPGAVIEIARSDYEYVDAELLLQDVAYFPLGNPESGSVPRVSTDKEEDIAAILQSLLDASALEGED